MKKILEQFKNRVGDIVAVVVVAAVLLAALNVYYKIKAHDAMDAALLQIVQQSQKVK